MRQTGDERARVLMSWPLGRSSGLPDGQSVSARPLRRLHFALNHRALTYCVQPLGTAPKAAPI